MRGLLLLLITTYCFGTRFYTIWSRKEIREYYCFGTYNHGIGDINGDGFDDFLVNREHTCGEADSTDANYVYMYLGRPILPPELNLTFEHRILESCYDGFGCLAFNGLGDVNGDGYDDFAIVADYAITDTNAWGDIGRGGKIYIYFGGPVPDTIPELIIKGHIRGIPGFWCGDMWPRAVCGADVNGDGYQDIVIGFPGYSRSPHETDMGRVYIYYGGTSIDTIPDVVITGGWYGGGPNGLPEQLGFALDNLGDINGDGYDDIIVGAPNNMERAPAAGKAYVYLGGNPMNIEPDWFIYGNDYLQDFGTIVSNAGDFNGDGFNDIMVGNYNLYPGGPRGVYIFYGAGLTKFDTIPDWGLDGQACGSLDCLGDINGDGYDDIVIADQTFPVGNLCVGRIMVFYGGVHPDSTPDIDYIGTYGIEDHTGWNTSNAGDVNGDGIDDIIFGTGYRPCLYGWVRVMRVTEAGLPDSISCRGGDRYVLIQWRGKYEGQTSHYQVLRSQSEDTLGWDGIAVLEPGFSTDYSVLDTAVEFFSTYYYWVRVFDVAGKSDLYGPYPASPESLEIGGVEARRMPGGRVHLRWQVRGGDIIALNLYREVHSNRERIATIETDWTDYSDTPPGDDVCYWLGILQSSGEERMVGPIVLAGIVGVWPNPFRNQVKIRVKVDKSGRYSLGVYNVVGQRVRVLWSGNRDAGDYELVWDGRDEHNRRLPAGVYYLIYRSGSLKYTKKLVLIR